MANPDRRGFGLLLASSATVLAVIALASLVGGLFASGVVKKAAAPTAASLALQGHGDEVLERFNGTETQRQASGLLQAWALNGPMDACMESAGFPEWDWSSGHRAAPRTNALGTSVWFATPLNASYSNALRDSIEYLAQEKALRTEVLTKRETSAVVECANSTPETSDDSADRASTPEIVSQLREQWWTMLDGWDSKYGDAEADESCFNEAIEDMSIDGASASSWMRRLAEAAPQPEDIPPASVEAKDFSTSWKDFLDLEKAFVSADWSCRGDVYEKHHQDVSRDIEQFAAENAAAIEQAERAWESIVKRAAELPSP